MGKKQAFHSKMRLFIASRYKGSVRVRLVPTGKEVRETGKRTKLGVLNLAQER